MNHLSARAALKLSAFIVSLGLLSACPNDKSGEAPPKTDATEPAKSGAGLVQTTPSPERTPHVKLVNDLAVFTLGVPLDDDDAEDKGAALRSGDLPIEQYVDELLGRDMSPRLAKDLVLAGNQTTKDRHPIPAHSTLRSFLGGGEKVYYLKEKCSEADAVQVDPWWEPGKKVLVCPSAYRQDAKGDDTGRSCGSSMLSPYDSEACGCGPRLMYCTRDKKHFRQTKSRAQNEVIATVGHVVNADLPIEELFLMNETVRNNTTEAIYRRARVAAGEDEKLLSVSGYGAFKGKLMPRHEMLPGQHAGVLTAPSMIYGSDALRGVLRNFYDYMWCTGLSSSRVTTEKVLGLDVVDLRVGDGWKQLAKMEICTDCHARLDYGMQFFHGYPSSTRGIDFRPAETLKGEGPTYGENIDDKRGVGRLTPQGFAKLAVAEPEFGDCMSKKVVDHVFNGTDQADDFKAVLEQFEATHRVKKMLRVAMLRYAKRALAPPAAGAAPVAATGAKPPPVVGEDGLVALTPTLRRKLDNLCMECHDKGDPYDYNGAALSRHTLAKMLDQVGFGQMPRTAAGLEEEERKAFVSDVVDVLFADATKRKAAESYFHNGLRAHPVHRFRSAVGNIGAVAGTEDGFRPNSIETAVSQSLMRYTPGIAVSTAVSALRTCKKAGYKGTKLATCVERASAPDTVIVGAMTARGSDAAGEGKTK